MPEPATTPSKSTTGATAAQPDVRLQVFSQPRYLCAAREMVSAVARRIGFDDLQCSQIALAIDEALANVMRHGYSDRQDGMIWVSLWPIGRDEAGSQQEGGQAVRQSGSQVNGQKSVESAAKSNGAVACNAATNGVHAANCGPSPASANACGSRAAGGPIGLRVVIEDEAKQVDPCVIKSRDLDEIRPGGLGVHIIRHVMDKVEYEKRDGKGMRLTLEKRM